MIKRALPDLVSALCTFIGRRVRRILFALVAGSASIAIATTAAAQLSADSGMRYKFGPLMEGLYAGNLTTIPDDQKTRSIVGSILRGIGEICQLTPADVTMKLGPYISPQMRLMSERPGQAIGNILMDLARARDSKNMMEGLTEFVEKQAAFVAEGVRDGRVFVADHRCASPAYDRITVSLYRIVRERSSREPSAYDEIEYTKLMSPAFRTEQGFADPAVALRKKKLTQAVANAERACKSTFLEGPFCGCTAGKLAQSDLDEGEWASIANDFRHIARVPRMRTIIAACY
jgi:hypothetical protein